MSQAELSALPYLFRFWAMPHQLPPDGDWRTWVILGGRGAGKTRAGAEWVRGLAEGPRAGAPGTAKRIALIGETIEQAREVMVFGESGILATSPPDQRPEWIAGRKMLQWENGATAQLFSAFDPESLRGPQFDAAWADELGCSAIDKGTNQPNKFLDPKSSESLLPHFSNGMRDDFIQMQYLRAVYGHYANSANNPYTDVEYEGRMLNMGRAHVWAWDARPFPFFPSNGALWSDGDNYARGHWLNGRTSSRTLASVVAEICERAGVTRFDVSQLYGLVRGYAVSDVGSGRAALQPLLLAFGLDAVEREGMLVFFNRDGIADATLTVDDLALDPERDTAVVHTRAPAAEIAGRVQVGYLDAEGDYDAAVTEVIHPEDQTQTISRSEFPIALTRAEGSRIASRWTHEARVAKDSATFALPPSRAELLAGDTVNLRDGENHGQYRIDRIEEAGLRMVEATRVDEEIYLPQPQLEEGARLKPFVAPTPVEAVFLDLPLLTGDEVPHEPHLALTARPWPGGVALYSAPQDSDYVLQDVFRQRSVVGITKTALASGPTGIWDRGSFDIKLVSGSVTSVSPETLFAGANTLAIGDGSPDNWEVLQFANVQMVAPRTYRITEMLRGQAGTDGAMPDFWPAGSQVVLLDGRPKQISIPTASRGNPRHYRYGPVNRPVSDRSYRHREMTFPGNGYRPYPVVHLVAKVRAAGYDIAWIRRTRIDGDLWGAQDVPIGETSERYVLRIMQGETIRREVTLTSNRWTYSDVDRLADVGSGPFVVSVAQISDRYGAGPFRELEIAGA